MMEYLEKLEDGLRRIKYKNQNQQRFAQLIQNKDYVIAIGPTGTGRTFISVIQSIRLLLDPRSKTKKIIITRPCINADNQNIGYLPGNIDEKIGPYLRPIYDILKNYFDLTDRDIEKMVRDGRLQGLPIAHVRGLTFKKAVVILDEAQNAQLKQIDAMIGRIDFGSKLIINGDPIQEDIGTGRALERKYIKFKASNSKFVDGIRFEQDDMQRNPNIAGLLEKEFYYEPSPIMRIANALEKATDKKKNKNKNKKKWWGLLLKPLSIFKDRNATRSTG